MSFKISNAIVSCHDKTGIREFAEGIVELNPEARIFSSSGTFKVLSESVRDNLVDISDYTGFKEMPSGIVKTLHPKIHGGILADLKDESQKAYLEENSIAEFDLVAVNLYPFKRTVEQGQSFEAARQNIDVGGVSLLESASKNFLRVAPVCSPEDYSWIIQEIKGKKFELESRLRLAKKSFGYLSSYFNDVNNYFSSVVSDKVK